MISKRRSEQVSRNAEAPGAEVGAMPAEASREGPEPDRTDVGGHVNAILHAAEAAAEQIRAEALREAAEIRRRAEAEANAQVQKLVEGAEQVRAEADTYAADTRRAAESYATQHRRDVDERASATLSEAEEQARAVREAAEEIASRIENAARQRREALRGEVEGLEGKVQRALSAFRDISGQLEELLDAASHEQAEESLVDSLQVDLPRLAAHRRRSDD